MVSSALLIMESCSAVLGWNAPLGLTIPMVHPNT